MAKDLSSQLTSDLNLPNFEAYKDTAAILNQLKSQNLVILANQLASEYDGDLMALDQQTQASLLLHMLYTREERNIDETALNFIEESLDPDEFKGLFSNRTVK